MTLARLRVLVADDEELARSRLIRLLDSIEGTQVVGQVADGDSLAPAIETARPDLVLLDVAMPSVDGFSALGSLPPERGRPAVVFVTAYDQFAVRAFEVDAVDYLLKPVDQDRLRAAIDRVRARQRGETDHSEWRRALDLMERRQRDLEHALAGARSPCRYLVRHNGREVVVAAGEVEAFETARNYVKLHLVVGDHYLLRQPLAKLETELDSANFVRIHRRTIINLRTLKEVQPWFWGDSVVVTARGRKFRMSRRFRDGFYRLFGRGRPPGS